MTSKEEKLKAQLELATGMYKAFCDGGQLSFENRGMRRIAYPLSVIKDNLEIIIKELAFELQMTTAFPDKEKEANSETK